MTLSVVIPTYNRFPFLLTALSSVYAQKYPPDEIIVVDDGSPPSGNTDFMSNLQYTSPIPLHYYTLKHSGKPSVVRNVGCRLAQGDLIAFLDDDDIWRPQKLRKQIKLHTTQEVHLSHTNETWIKNGTVISQPPITWERRGSIFISTLDRCIVSPSTMIVERAFFNALGGFNEKLEIAEDYEFLIRASMRTTIEFLDQPFIFKVGGHSTQLSMRYPYVELFRIDALRHILKEQKLGHFRRRALQSVLIDKCRRWAQGCVKRGKPEEAYRYRLEASQIEQEID